MGAKTRRVTCTLPKTLVEDLDVIAKAFRCTRSALLTQIMTEAAHDLRGIVENHVIPLQLGEGNAVESVRAIEDTLDRVSNEIEMLRNANVGSVQ